MSHHIKQCIHYLLLMLLFNFSIILPALPGKMVTVSFRTSLFIYYIYYNLFPAKSNFPKRRLRILQSGYHLMQTTMICFSIELFLSLFFLLKGTEIGLPTLIIHGISCTVLLFVLLINGILRIFICSRQLGIFPRICLLLFWWIPVINLIVFHKFLHISRTEYQFTMKKHDFYMERKHEELCKTKYPLLMVHGIFFRDWENFNYWGRIPEVLKENGATIYYGNHQSSASVEQCAGEIKQSILNIIEETGCEKVNIIAHSKGGLDTRYALSCLGMDQYAASLTTINTPHMGCNYVRRILNAIPIGIVSTIGKKYESLYTKLGDDNPDFFNGLQNLTDQECSRLNHLMKDSPNVLYQSVGSQMRSLKSAMFPLNLGYCMIKWFGGGNNDGLVSTDSMVWGDFLGIWKSKGKKGISHGDVIDLTRKNIEGFDVFEFYVDLVNNLKIRNF